MGEDGGPGGSDGGGPSDAADGGTNGPRCDPAQLFEEPVLLTTAPSSINTNVEDGWPRVSRDDMTLYWVRAEERDGGRLLGGNLFFVTRDDPGSLFDSETVAYEQEFVAGANNDAPFLLPDGRGLYYSNGADHIYHSERGGGGGPFPYPGEPVNFTTEGVRDMHPYLVDDTLYFTSSRAGDVDDLNVFRAVKNGGAFDAPQSAGITAASEVQQIAPVVSSDQRVVFFSADGTLYRAVRLSGGFDTAVPADDLNGGISYPGSLSRDDCVLYLHSDRGGGDFDLYMARATAMLGE